MNKENPDNETVISLDKREGCNQKRGLSALQKRIVVYARKAMIAKEQTIDNSDVVLEFSAPKWLSDALEKAMEGVFRGRKFFQREKGNKDTNVSLDLTRWTQLFDEVAYVEGTIKNAAKEAGVKRDGAHFTTLYEWINDSGWLSFLAVRSGGKIGYHPWPYYDGNRFYFVVELLNNKITKANIPNELNSYWRTMGKKP